MPRQLAFDLPVRPALGRGDFFVSPANALALAALDDSARWPLGRLVLTGPAGSGKSHLARVWAAAVGAEVLDAVALPGRGPETLPAGGGVAVEDADRIAGDPAAETALFHLVNLMQAAGGRLLITGARPPSVWGVALPDLASRLEAGGRAAVEPPDDALLAAVLVKLFADRQVRVPPALIPWLVARMERSFEAARDLVARLDARALAEGRPIGQRLAAELLDSAGDPAP